MYLFTQGKKREGEDEPERSNTGEYRSQSWVQIPT
jgi:hypothetical protein